MEQKRKNDYRKYILLGLLTLLSLFLAVLPFIAEARRKDEENQASILSETVAVSSVNTTLSGAGTLTDQEAVNVTVPDGVKVTEYLVSNGEQVRQGDAVAAVDRVSVMQTIATVQENLEYLAESMEEAAGQQLDGFISAEVGGRVMAVYAQAGDSVRDVMLKHGALAVLSLDGRLALDIPADVTLHAGQSVLVTLPDDTRAEGRVERVQAGTATITISADDAAVGDAAGVKTEDGVPLGAGELYIHSEYRVTGFAGTISSVSIREGQTVYVGSTLFRLSDTDFTAEFELLAAQRREYEDVMIDLFCMYQTGQLTAPCDGFVSGVDDSLLTPVSAAGQGASLALLAANTPNGSDEASYTNYVGRVSAVSFGSFAVMMQPGAAVITDYLDLSGVSTSPDTMTVETTVTPTAAAMVYVNVDGAWQQMALSSITAEDILLFAYDEAGSLVWMVCVQKAPVDPSGGEQLPDGGQEQPSVVIGGAGGGMVVAEEPFEMYEILETTMLSVTPEETLTITITMDELDILSVYLGQEAAITVDALPGRCFAGTVTEINTVGSNSGGSSKYTVVVTMDRGEDMLGGMNAGVLLTVDTHEGVLSVPVEALVEDGARTIVYTGYNEADGVLCDPVEVTTGVSDGTRVEITSGLTEGDTIWFAYYDTLPIADALADMPRMAF